MHLHYLMSRFNANMRWCALNALFVQQTDDFTILYLMVNPGKKRCVQIKHFACFDILIKRNFLGSEMILYHISKIEA